MGGIDTYQVALGTSTSPAQLDLAPWTPVSGVARSHAFHNLTIPDGTTCYAFVRALDAAGHVSGVTRGSGQVWDGSPPAFSGTPSLGQDAGSAVSSVAARYLLLSCPPCHDPHSSVVGGLAQVVRVEPGTGAELGVWCQARLGPGWDADPVLLACGDSSPLEHGARYSGRCMCTNGAGLTTGTALTPGVTVDITPPTCTFTTTVDTTAHPALDVAWVSARSSVSLWCPEPPNLFDFVGQLCA